MIKNDQINERCEIIDRTKYKSILPNTINIKPVLVEVFTRAQYRRKIGNIEKIDTILKKQNCEGNSEIQIDK